MKQDMPEQDSDTSAEKNAELDATIKVGFIFFCVAIALFFLIIFIRIIGADVNLWDENSVPPDMETAALIAANERVLQLVQWTVSTILVVAGGLLGLNWYQNQKRYDDDKAALAKIQREMERRYQRGLADLDEFKKEIDAKLAVAMQAQERLDEKHRERLVTEAVRELTSTDTVEEAFSVIMAWYGQIREEDNSEQQRAGIFAWQGFNYIVNLMAQGEPAVFHSGGPEAESGFHDFLAELKSDYPEITEYVDLFKRLAEEQDSGDKKAGA